MHTSMAGRWPRLSTSSPSTSSCRPSFNISINPYDCSLLIRLMIKNRWESWKDRGESSCSCSLVALLWAGAASCRLWPPALIFSGLADTSLMFAGHPICWADYRWSWKASKDSCRNRRGILEECRGILIDSSITRQGFLGFFLLLLTLLLMLLLLFRLLLLVFLLERIWGRRIFGRRIFGRGIFGKGIFGRGIFGRRIWQEWQKRIEFRSIPPWSRDLERTTTRTLSKNPWRILNGSQKNLGRLPKNPASAVADLKGFQGNWIKWSQKVKAMHPVRS